MIFYTTLFIILLIGVELSSFAMRVFRYDFIFLDSSFYLGNTDLHIINLGLVASIVAIFYYGKRKSGQQIKKKDFLVINSVSAIYFLSIFFIVLYALVSSEAVTRLSIQREMIAAATIAVSIFFLNLFLITKLKTSKAR